MIDAIDAFWVPAAVLLPPIAARIGIHRLDAGSSVGWCRLLTVSGLGATLGTSFHILAHMTTGAQASNPMSIVMIAFFAVSGYVDSRTAWAPSELIVPVCLMSGVVFGFDSGFDCLTGLLAGFVLWLAAHIVWPFQLRAGRPWLPPADLVALVLPVLLFGASTTAAICLLALSILLGLAWFGGLQDSLTGNPDALKEAAIGRSFGDRKPVALLGVAMPVLIAAMLADVALNMSEYGN